ncbi:hypothetical protein BN2364_1090 [Alloalcanivorax xenomutans]|nr:hypothetical protein BN2364_1090 [Alloalcanivorax xenomutans]
MHSLNKLMCVLIFATALASCASSTPHGSVPPTPLPADLMVPCPAPSKPAGDTKEDMAVTVKIVLDEYGLCAGRLFELQDELLQRGARGAQ